MTRILKVIGFIVGGLVLVILLLIGASFVFPSIFAPRYTLQTLPSGNSYKITGKGPIIGNGWKGLSVSYITDTEDSIALEKNAQDLFHTIKNEAEANNFGTVVIMAKYIVSKKGLFSEGRKHNAVFERSSSGEWQHNGSSMSSFMPNNVVIKFGILELAPNGTGHVIQETNVIPLRYQSEHFCYGLEFSSPSNESYQSYLVIYLPKSPKILSGSIQTESVDAAVRGIRTPTQTTSGTYVIPMYFDPGDPSGNYKIEVYINGSFFKTIGYDVVESIAAK